MNRTYQLSENKTEFSKNEKEIINNSNQLLPRQFGAPGITCILQNQDVEANGEGLLNIENATYHCEIQLSGEIQNTYLSLPKTLQKIRQLSFMNFENLIVQDLNQNQECLVINERQTNGQFEKIIIDVNTMDNLGTIKHDVENFQFIKDQFVDFNFGGGNLKELRIMTFDKIGKQLQPITKKIFNQGLQLLKVTEDKIYLQMESDNDIAFTNIYDRKLNLLQKVIFNKENLDILKFDYKNLMIMYNNNLNQLQTYRNFHNFESIIYLRSLNPSYKKPVDDQTNPLVQSNLPLDQVPANQGQPVLENTRPKETLTYVQKVNMFEDELKTISDDRYVLDLIYPFDGQQVILGRVYDRNDKMKKQKILAVLNLSKQDTQKQVVEPISNPGRTLGGQKSKIQQNQNQDQAQRIKILKFQDLDINSIRQIFFVDTDQTSGTETYLLIERELESQRSRVHQIKFNFKGNGPLFTKEILYTLSCAQFPLLYHSYTSKIEGLKQRIVIYDVYEQVFLFAPLEKTLHPQPLAPPPEGFKLETEGLKKLKQILGKPLDQPDPEASDLDKYEHEWLEFKDITYYNECFKLFDNFIIFQDQIIQRKDPQFIQIHYINLENKSIGTIKLKIDAKNQEEIQKYKLVATCLDFKWIVLHNKSIQKYRLFEMTDDLRVERQLHINDGHNYDMVMIGEDNFIFKNKAVKDFRSSEFIIQDLFLSLEELSYIIPLSSTVKFNLIHDQASRGQKMKQIEYSTQNSQKETTIQYLNVNTLDSIFFNNLFENSYIYEIFEQFFIKEHNLPTQIYNYIHPEIGSLAHLMAAKNAQAFQSFLEILDVSDMKDIPFLFFKNKYGYTPMQIALSRNQLTNVDLIIKIMLQYHECYELNFVIDEVLNELIQKGANLNEYFDSKMPFPKIVGAENLPQEHTDQSEVTVPIKDIKDIFKPNYDPFAGKLEEPQRKIEEKGNEGTNIKNQGQPQGQAQGQINQKKQNSNADDELHSQPIEYFLVNLPEQFTATKRRELIKALAESNDMELFEKEPIQYIIKYKWDTFAKWFFIKQFICFLFFVVFYVIDIYFSMKVLNHDESEHNFDVYIDSTTMEVVLIILKVACISILVYFFSYEMKSATVSVFDYFSDPWNYTDLAQIIVYGTIQIVFYLDLSDDAFKVLSCFVVLLSFIKICFFLRIFDGFSFLVSMLIGVFIDLKFFLAFFLMVLLVFGTLFWILAIELSDAYSGIGQFGYGVMSFRTSTGDFDVDNFANQTITIQTFAWIIWFAAVIVLNIIFMNFIIAVISESYENVMQKLKSQTYKVRVDMIAEREHNLSDKEIDASQLTDKPYFPKYLLIRRPADMEKNELEQWQGFVRDIKSQAKMNTQKILDKNEQGLAQLSKKVNNCYDLIKKTSQYQTTAMRQLLSKPNIAQNEAPSQTLDKKFDILVKLLSKQFQESTAKQSSLEQQFKKQLDMLEAQKKQIEEQNMINLEQQKLIQEQGQKILQIEKQVRVGGDIQQKEGEDETAIIMNKRKGKQAEEIKKQFYDQ